MYDLINKVLAAPPPPAGGKIPGGGQIPCGGGGEIVNPIKFCEFTDLLNAIGDWLFIIATPLITVMILYGAFQMMIAAGDPEQFNKGKKTILYSIIGFAVVLVAAGLPDLIKSLFDTANP